MSKKSIIVIVITFTLLVLGIGVFFLLNQSPISRPQFLSTLPFGKGDDSTTPGPVTPPNMQSAVQAPGGEQGNLPGLQKISNGPVSGSILYMQGSTTLVRFMERATGNIFEFNSLTNTNKRITNTTIPKGERVLWGNGGQSLLLQFVKDGGIQNYFGSIATTTASSTDELVNLIGNYIDEPIVSFAFSPNKNTTFALIRTGFGVDGYLANAKVQGLNKVWSSRTTEWIPQFATNDTVYLTTGASEGISGYLYSLNIKTGAFIPILSDVKGLTTLVNSDGSAVLFSTSENGVVRLFAYFVKTKTTAIQPFTTLPEKCAWLSTTQYTCGVPLREMSGSFPDDWYMGNATFDDYIVTADIANQEIMEISNTEIKDASEAGIDVINLQTNPDGTTLTFQNKKDLSQWVFPLSIVGQ